MFSGSNWLLLMIMWSAIGFGAAFAGLAPIGGSDPRYFLRPFWYGFRAILGDFDIEYTYELLGDTYTPSQGLMGGMLITVQYFYSAFTTIYIVNLYDEPLISYECHWEPLIASESHLVPMSVPLIASAVLSPLQSCCQNDEPLIVHVCP